MHKKRLKNWVRVALFSIGIVLTTVFSLISAVLLYRSYNPATHNKNLLVSYNSEDSLNYKITTKENDYYLDTDLGMDKQYVSSIIDKISFSVGYNFNSSKVLDYKYDYSIVATLVGNYDGGSKNNELWSKEFILEPSTSIELESSNDITINKKFDIDYQTYNSVMQSFKNEFNLMVDAYLNIDFKVNVKSAVGENNQIDESNLINIKMPLLSDTTYIDYTKTGIKDNNIWTTVSKTEQTTIFLKILYGVALILGLVLDGLLLLKVYKTTEKDRYFYELNKIFKFYADILVEVEEIPEHHKLKNIKVSNFKDMIDVNEELHLPILYFEGKNKTNFFIMSDIYYYEFILSKEKLNSSE